MQALLHAQHSSNIGNLLGVPSEVPMLGTYWDLVKSQYNSNILGTCWAVGPAKTQCWELTGRFTQLSPNVGNVLDTHSNAG